VFSLEDIVVTVVEGIASSFLEVLLFTIVGFCCTCCCCLKHPFYGLFLGKLSLSPYRQRSNPRGWIHEPKLIYEHILEVYIHTCDKYIFH
jgi:hypothetical protein